jgi:small-conductance mechanosensitive channel
MTSHLLVAGPRPAFPATPPTSPVAQDWQTLTFTILGLGAALLVALLLHRMLWSALRRLFARTKTPLDDVLLRRLRWPLLLVLVVLAVRTALPSVGLPLAADELLQHGLSIAVIVAVAWLLLSSLHGMEWLVVRRHDLEVADNLRARRVHTQVRIMRRCLGGVVIAVAVAAVLMTFPRLRQLGTSLLASAGIAGLVAGLAARPALENLIAGLQLAFTEPIRLDDVVIVAGEWGRVEEICATYVVVRTWDERRLIVPFAKFLSEPFQNWTRTSAEITGAVVLHADYRVPVDAVREELSVVVRGSALWDGRVCGLHVTDATPSTIVLRALVSARDASSCWDLRCLVREKLLAFLQERHPASLPRLRAELHWQPQGGQIAGGLACP